MKVKCPKCRLTFEVKTIPGITEVACNCPRCGTPFTYQLSEEEADDTAPDTAPDAGPAAGEAAPPQTNATDSGQAGANGIPPQPNTHQQDQGQQGATYGRDANGYSQPSRSTMPKSDFGQPLFNPLPSNQPQKPKSCLSSCVNKMLGAVLVIAAIIIVANKCSGSSSDDYAPSADVEQPKDASSPSASHEADDFVEVNAQKAPDWIQGTWIYDDDGEDGLGRITIVIHGNHLKEQINDMEAAEGTFYYSAGTLHFESPDGRSRCDYPLNHKRKSIEWQDGKFMHKAD